MTSILFSPNLSMRPVNRAFSVFLIFVATLFVGALLSCSKADTKTNSSGKFSQDTDFQEFTKKMQAGEWQELPGKISEVFVEKEQTQGDGGVVGPSSVVIAWNGAAWDDSCGYFLGGGHQDYGGNEVYAYCWSGKQPFHWQVLMPPSKSDPDDKNKCPHPKEGPRAYHTYDGLTYVPDTKSIFIWGSVGYCSNNMMGADEVPELLLASNPKWKLHPKGPINGYAHTAYNNKNGKVYVWQGSGQVYIVDPKNLNYETSGSSTADYGANANMIYDSQRNVIWTTTGLGLFQFVIGPKGEVIEFKQIVSANNFPAGLSAADGLDIRKGKIYFWSGNNVVIKFDPDSTKWTTYFSKNGPTSASNNGIFSKWRYLEKYDVFVGLSHYNQGLWMWKPSEGEGQPDTRHIKVCKPGSNNCTDNKLIEDALKGIPAGSSIKFSAGHYSDSAVITDNNLNLSAEPGSSIAGIAAGKATFVAVGNDMVFDNFDISIPVSSASSNEACFRGEGSNLTLKNIYCHDTQMSVIGGPGSLIIDHSKFENTGLNGNADLGHMVYACSNAECPDGSLVIRDTTFTKMGVARPGHAIKSRAPNNLIENVVIAGLDAKSGRAIDISQGGKTTIKNVVMQLGINNDNEDFIAIGLEEPRYDNIETDIENVIAICDQTQPCDFVRYKGPVPKLKNITLIGNFRFYDDLFPLPRDEIKIYKNRSDAGLKPYPFIPEKWMEINRPN